MRRYFSIVFRTGMIPIEVIGIVFVSVGVNLLTNYYLSPEKVAIINIFTGVLFFLAGCFSLVFIGYMKEIYSNSLSIYNELSDTQKRRTSRLTIALNKACDQVDFKKNKILLITFCTLSCLAFLFMFIELFNK